MAELETNFYPNKNFKFHNILIFKIESFELISIYFKFLLNLHLICFKKKNLCQNPSDQKCGSTARPMIEHENFSLLIHAHLMVDWIAFSFWAG